VSFSINTVTVDGNLTRDPELRSTSGGTSVCSLRIAHTARRKDSSGEWVDVPNYFDVTIWSGQGEWVANNVSKGTKVVVSGRLQWREWEKDGNKRQAVDIVAEGIVVMRDSDGGGRFNPATDVPADTTDFTPAAAPAGGDDDIPF
jgi:single-strand DNA-binding protein